jgi:hypothetical protein
MFVKTEKKNKKQIRGAKIKILIFIGVICIKLEKFIKKEIYLYKVKY